MDLSTLFNTNTIPQSLSVAIIVYIIRTWLEFKWASLITNKLFTGVVWPSLAIAVSLVISFCLPVGVATDLSSKLAYGLLCGFSSSYIFSALKAFLAKAIQ